MYLTSLNVLFGLCTFAVLSAALPQSGSCRCNGRISDKGNGECQTTHQGSAYCYVESNACTDQQESSQAGWFWSFEACKTVLWIPEGSSSLTLSLPSLSPENSNCEITNHGVKGYYSQFQMIQGKLYVCNHLECKSYNDEAKRWDSQVGMKFQNERGWAASTVIGDKWIVQGFQFISIYLINAPTTEEWTPGQPNWKVSTNNKYISPYPVQSHCLLTLQSDGNNKVMQIGGYSRADKVRTKRCFIDGQEVASMKTGRQAAGCSVFQGKVYVTGGDVTGGEYNNVEIYDPQRDQWTDGPRLPYTGSDYSPQLVEIKNELHYIGGRSSGKIWRLGNNRWEEVAQVEKSDKFAAAVMDKHCE